MSKNTLTKKQARKQVQRALAALSPMEKELEAEQMVENITRFVQASPTVKRIASYAAMSFELNLDALHDSLSEVSFCYPKCGIDGQMEFYEVSDLSEMNASDYGIREPNEAVHNRVAPESIDLFLCPAYAYSPNGQRLGKGGGFYDRYLLRRKPEAITLGVAFSCQILPHVPTEAHDLTIDRVL